MYLFGSVAKKSCRPSDVDVLICYPLNEEATALSVRKVLRGASSIFENQFGVPINLLVLSRAELTEVSGKIGDLVKVEL